MKTRILSIVALALVGLVALVSVGRFAVAADADADTVSQPTRGLCGNWGGIKTHMSDKGYDVNLVYKGEWVANVRGGLERKSTFLGNIDLTLDMDMEKIAGVSGLRVFFYGLGNHGGDPSTFIGDHSVTSNIEAPNTFKLYEAYFQQEIDERFSMLAGLRDLNAEFYVTESSKLLLNSTFGVSKALSQAKPNGPSIFPTTALAINARYESPNGFYFLSGAFNAVAGHPNHPHGTHITTSTNQGYLFIHELGWQNEEKLKAAVGSWAYTKVQDPVDPANPKDNNWGFYLLLDYPVTAHISAFVRHGIASPHVNDVRAATEVGVATFGLVPGRADDKAVLGFAHMRMSDDYRAQNTTDHNESIVEVAYHAAIRDGLTLIPDYQLVVNPGATTSVSDSNVISVRAEIQF